MSVLWIGEQRFAAGFLWQRGQVTGRAARRAARESRGAWTVDVAGQTGFLDDAEGPEGTKPLAGALMALLRGRTQEDAAWIAFVEEDSEGGSGSRVGVVRCGGGMLLADGDVVYASAQEAVEAVDLTGTEDLLVAATPGLRDTFPDAVRLEPAGLIAAAAEADLLAPVRSGGLSRKGMAWLAVFAAVGVAGIVGWSNQRDIGIWFGWIEEKKERPRVTVAVESRRFLALCLEGIGRRELGLAGFDRIGVFCHAQYGPDGNVGAPWELTGRPVLEVRWRLRKPLQPRVYVGLAETRLDPWYWAGVSDKGDAVGIDPLPQVLERFEGAGQPEHPEFRARIDSLLALRGFRIEYDTKQTGIEVVLETERPLSEAVALVSAIEGLEVASVSFEGGRWRFEGRRSLAQGMFQDEFERLVAPLAGALPATGAGKRRRVV